MHQSIMAMVLSCECGKRLRVPESLVGKRCKYPGCGTVLAVPEVARAERDTAESDRTRATRPPLREAAKPPRKEKLEGYSDSADDYEREPANEAPRKRKKRRKSSPAAKKPGFFSGFDFGFERSASNSGILAGVLMMVGAIVWFICGLIYMDRIFFYPPVLFVVGLVALIRGIVSRA